MYGNLEGIMRVTFNAPGSLVSRCETALFRTFTGTFSFFFFNSFTNSFISSKLLAAYELAVKRCDEDGNMMWTEVLSLHGFVGVCEVVPVCVSMWH